MEIFTPSMIHPCMFHHLLRISLQYNVMTCSVCLDVSLAKEVVAHHLSLSNQLQVFVGISNHLHPLKAMAMASTFVT
uniref:Uncharacterized protein n=1 Tax=Oryza brachyantha TaxID=4533 RepID=J3NES3_ORYBR